MNFRKLKGWLEEYFFGSRSRDEYDYHINFCKEMSMNKKDFRKQYRLVQASKVIGVRLKDLLTTLEVGITALYAITKIRFPEADINFPWQPLLLGELIRVIPTGFNYIAKTFMMLHREELSDLAKKEQKREELERKGEEWKQWG
jgi:hypothetical protein